MPSRSDPRIGFDPVDYSLQLEQTLGIPPLVRVRGKGPFDANWSQGPMQRPNEWREKLRGWTGNLGMVTGNNMVGLDIDLYVPGADASWEALAERGFTVYTVTTITGGGGRHYLYALPSGITVASHPLPGYPGVDVKGQGGCLVVPPSIHPITGEFYEWEFSWGPFDTPLFELDMAQVELLGVGSIGTEHIERELDVRDETAVSILVDHFGGHSVKRKAHTIEVTRPDKEHGCSAEVGYFDPGTVRVWSSNWPGLPADIYPAWKLRKLAGIPDHRIKVKAAAERKPKTPDLWDLLQRTGPKYNWCIPDLLEKGDRLVLTGKEGGGKSTLLRQIGVGAACGVNTLSSNPITRHHDPRRVLLLDLENTPWQLQREFWKVAKPIEEPDLEGIAHRLFPVLFGGGLVLDQRSDRDRHRKAIIELIEDIGPDILIIGPIYKMIEGDPTDEQPNRDLVKWLDTLRIEYDLTILLEGHTPHDAVRPYGWSGWKRWPEFGIHLHENGKLEHWRGMRDERPFPTNLVRGNVGDWPWHPSSASGETSPNKHEAAVIEAEVAVIRCMGQVKRPMAADEIVEWVGMPVRTTQTAIARLRERGMFVTSRVQRERSNGRFYPIEMLSLDPEMSP